MAGGPGPESEHSQTADWGRRAKQERRGSPLRLRGIKSLVVGVPSAVGAPSATGTPSTHTVAETVSDHSLPRPDTQVQADYVSPREGTGQRGAQSWSGWTTCGEESSSAAARKQTLVPSRTPRSRLTPAGPAATGRRTDTSPGSPAVEESQSEHLHRSTGKAGECRRCPLWSVVWFVGGTRPLTTGLHGRPAGGRGVTCVENPKWKRRC